MALYEEDVFEDLAYEEAEGAAEAYDEFEEGEGFEEFEEFEEGEEGFDEFEEDAFLEGEEGFEEFEEFEGEEFAEGEEADEEFESGLAYALGAEDSDEFLRRLRGVFRRVVNVARRAAPVVGQIARTAAPILSLIPHPAAQVAGRVASVAGNLLSQGASEDEAMDAFAELAVRNRRAIPVVAAVTARNVLGPRAARMTPSARRQAVRVVTSAARTLVARGGPRAVRALPRIARSVRRTGAARRTPPTARPQIIRRTAARVATRPTLVRRLSRPTPQVRRVGSVLGGGVSTRGAPVRRGGPARPVRTFRIPGPTIITIRQA
jgi:hypothetical protein